MAKFKKPREEDLNYALIKIGISSIPIVGKPIAEILPLILISPMERRRNEWQIGIGQRLKNLEDKGIVLEKLRDNDLFIDSVLYATQLALRTSEAEKIQYLKNAVINIAAGEKPEDALIKIFLNMIDQFTVWHIKILKLFDDPDGWYSANHKSPPANLMMAGLTTILIDAYPELETKKDFYNLVWSDLQRAGLHNTGSLSGIMSANSLFVSRTSEMGKQFLRFILEPVDHN